uniref:Uncharacterized protein n=1 Tax=Nelumbo nucifera TaxID=4432 RepID=A0A822ZPX9_NELNU|nr:TPA_asm: hypothetical protein HUJ06_002078 [Nelumbo nucifera]
MAFSRPLASCMLLVCLLFSFSEAREILVGGKTDAWEIPSSEPESLNRWAGASRFQIGDSLGNIPSFYSKLFTHLASLFLLL